MTYSCLCVRCDSLEYIECIPLSTLNESGSASAADAPVPGVDGGQVASEGENMNVRHVLVPLAAAGALLVISAAPAFAAGPPVPAGCSFDQATGVLTCVTTTASTSIIGPFTTNGYVVARTTFGGVTGTQICQNVYGHAERFINLADVSLDITVTTTRTTEEHGLNGKVFDTSTSALTRLDSVVRTAGAVGCNLSRR
jgi:hypothetical protein